MTEGEGLGKCQRRILDSCEKKEKDLERKEYNANATPEGTGQAWLLGTRMRRLEG